MSLEIMMEGITNEGLSSYTLPNEDDKGLCEEEQLNLAAEVKKEKVEQERLQAELSQRPKVLATSPYSEFKFPDPKTETELAIDGMLYKKESKSSNWRKYYFKMKPRTLELVYYNSKDECLKGKTGSVIPVSWVWADKAGEEDRLVQKQVRFNILRGLKVEVCTYRVSVYSPQRTYILSAQNDQEIMRWVTMILKILSFMLSTEERRIKEAAAQQLGPLQHKQLKMEKEQYKLIVQSLQTAGIFPDRPTGKRREGYLEMQKADGSWKKYYFVLFKESLSYFNLDDKVLLPRGVILLESISSIRVLERKISPQRSPPKSPDDFDFGLSPMELENQVVKKEERLPKQPFMVYTALRTYTLRAKHEEAMKDWVISINLMRSGGIPVNMEMVTTRKPEEVEGMPIQGAKHFTYLQGGKAKKIMMKKDSVVLGRSTKSDILITDVKVSRNHCRIEMTPEQVPVLYDLGSLGGTLLNGKRVIKSALRPGDIITVGTTEVVFGADQPQTASRAPTVTSILPKFGLGF